MRLIVSPAGYPRCGGAARGGELPAARGAAGGSRGAAGAPAGRAAGGRGAPRRQLLRRARVARAGPRRQDGRSQIQRWRRTALPRLLYQPVRVQATGMLLHKSTYISEIKVV